MGEWYQMKVGEYGGMRSEDYGTVRLGDSDLWKETRLGAPTAGGVWDRVQGQRIREGGELGQDSEAGERGGAQGDSEKGSREDEWDDDVTADGGKRRTGGGQDGEEGRRGKRHCGCGRAGARLDGH